MGVCGMQVELAVGRIWAASGQLAWKCIFFAITLSSFAHTQYVQTNKHTHTHVRGLYRGVPVHFGTSLSTGISDQKWHSCSCSCVCSAAWPTSALLTAFVEALNRESGREGEVDRGRQTMIYAGYQTSPVQTNPIKRCRVWL